MADKNKLVILGGLGVLGYFAYTQGWLSQFFGSAAMPSSGGGGGSVQPVLTAADAAVFPYSGSVTAAQMNAISSTLQSQIAAGQIPQIAGNSVLAYMLGWGGLAAGTSKTTSGETYVFDGTNWNLGAVAPSTPATTQTATVTKKALSDALTAWATSNGYGAQLSVSQWNWILNNRVAPGTAPEMTGPANPISSKDYVALLTGDATFDTSKITPNYSLSGLGDYEDDGWMLPYAYPWAPSRVPMSLIHGGPWLRFWREA